MKQALAAILVRLGAIASRSVLTRLDVLAEGMGGMSADIDRLSVRLDAIEASMSVLHQAVEDLAAIPSLSTELVDGIAEAEARAAERLTEVERLLAGR